jgi:hypothetical protein
MTPLYQFSDWQFDNGAYGTFAHRETELHGFTIRQSIGDDDMPVEWGDMEPTEAERENASSYYVAVQVLEAGAEVHHGGIGGVDVIDLPGYAQRDWEDAAEYAWKTYLGKPAIRFAELEHAERAHWAARDVMTVA